MTKSRRDPAELAALIEQGVAKGLDLVDAFKSVTGKGPRGTSRALEIEHRKALAANRKLVSQHRSKVNGLKTEMTGGAVVAGVGGSIGLVDVAANLGGGDVFLPTWLWFGSAAIGLIVSVRARRRLKTVGPAPAPIAPVAPPPALPRGAVAHHGDVHRLQGAGQGLRRLRRDLRRRPRHQRAATRRPNPGRAARAPAPWRTPARVPT